MNQKVASEQSSARVSTLRGVVVSDRMDKTVTVMVERSVRHPMYGKYIRRSSKIHAHDEENEYREGDIVRIAPCRPLSKNKSWYVTRLIERPAKVADLDSEALGSEALPEIEQ